MNYKIFFLGITLISVSITFGQYTSQTGLRISDATATTPSPGVKFWGSADTDGFLYSTKFINGYGFGFYNKSNGDSYNNGMNTYLSGFFGMDFFTNSQLRLRISREGNVGIGTETPTTALDVIGNIKTTENFLFGNSHLNYDQGGAVVLNSASGTSTPYLDFNKFGETNYFSSRIALLAPQQYTNNQPKLTVLGTTLTLQQGVEFLHSAYENGFGSKIYGTDNGNGTTSLRFAIRANTHTFTDAMVIRTDYGNVGIGTEIPTAKLHVSSSVIPESSIAQVDANLVIEAKSTEKSIDKGATLGFVIPSNTDGGNLWQQGRILVASDKMDTFNADGRMYIQTRFFNYSNSTWDWNNNLVLRASGNVGIGTSSPTEKLTVKGTIRAEEVRIELGIAPDYVFEKYYDGYSTLKSEYKMPTLQEVEAYTKENKHLPEVPSAKEIKENGLKLGEMNAILLQKVEELTLYLIEQNKEIEKLKTKVDELSKK